MEKRRAPKLRFRGFTDDWEQRKLGEVCNVSSGIMGDSLLTDGVYRITRIETIADGVVDEARIGYTNQKPDDVFRLNPGDILYSNINSLPQMGKVAQYTGNSVLYHGINLLRLSPKNDVDSNFILYLLNTESSRNWAQTHANQAVSQASINRSLLESQEVMVGRTDEQKQIGNYFKDLDYLITLHQRKYDMLQKVKKSMLEKMFPKNGSKVPEIRFAGFTDDWEKRKLGEMGTTFTGLSGKTKDDFGHGAGRFVTYMNVFTNPVSDLEVVDAVEIDNSQSTVQYGDVFFTTSSETPEEVGMSSVWLGNTTNTYLNSFCFGYRLAEANDPYYMAYMLRSENVRGKIIFLAQGISRYNISKNRVMQIEVPIPNLDEQRLLGKYFKNLDHLITLHQRKLEKLKKLKKSMLEEMFI